MIVSPRSEFPLFRSIAMTSEELRNKAKQAAICYFDKRCSTGFVMCSTGLLKILSEEFTDLLASDYETMQAVFEGFLDGIVEAEILYNERNGKVSLSSPFVTLESRMQSVQNQIKTEVEYINWRCQTTRILNA
jgi:hypothetical protein